MVIEFEFRVKCNTKANKTVDYFDGIVGVVGDLNVRHEETGGVGVLMSIRAKVEHNFLAVIIHDVERERLGLRQPGAEEGRALVEAKHDAVC